MVDVTYRKLLPADAKPYRTLRLESLQLHPEHFGARFEEQTRLPELRLETFIKQRDSYHFVVGAFNQDNLIGICGFVPERDHALEKTGTLIQMYVRKSFGGQKVGLGLVQATLTEAFALPKIERVILEVKEDNRQAVHVYEQAGFRNLSSEESDSIPNKTQLMVIHVPSSEQLSLGLKS